jgi:hypothetical protein
MRLRFCILPIVVALSLLTGCDGSGATSTAPPAHTAQSTGTSTPMATTATTPCPPANAGGTVPPAIAICSVSFLVNGVEQVVRDGDALQASRGDEVQIGEASICVGPFSGSGGEACVDFVPIDSGGQEIASERNGTHNIKVSPGCRSIPGPGGTWTIGEGWAYIAAVLNHWPPSRTEDAGCAGGLCERDDRITVDIQ